MTIAFVNSTRQSGSLVTGFTMTVDVGSGTDRLLVVNLLLRGAPLQNVTEIKYNNVALATDITPYSYTTNQRAYMFYLPNPTAGSNQLSVTFAAQISMYECQVSWYTGALQTSPLHVQNGAYGASSTPGFDLTPTENDCLLVGTVVHERLNALTTDAGEIAIYNYDNGAWVTSSSYAIQTTAATQTINWTATSADTWAAVGAAFKSNPAQSSPTSALNTADDSEFADTTPALDFTITDAEADDVRANIQITDNPDEWVGGSTLEDNLQTGSGTNIHPNPLASGTTWEGKIPVDDRPGMVFLASGGILDKIEANFGPHETTPEDTDGTYLIRVYASDGYPVGTVPPAWVGSTSKSVGNEVRPVSTANADIHFIYRATIGGTTGGTEPTWPQTPGNTVSDGGVTWECIMCGGPANRATYDNTPTPGWLAQSTEYAYAPGVADGGWKVLEFTGVNRIRLTDGVYYCFILDWWPNDRVSSNAIVVSHASLTAATALGNSYLDGQSSNNNGPRIIDDMWFKVYEVFDLVDKVSGTDSGFENVDTPADTDPFNSGDQLRFTVQSALIDGLYYWRVRGIDPSGSNTYGSWTAARTFTIQTGIVPANASSDSVLDSPTITQVHALSPTDAASDTSIDSPALTQDIYLSAADVVSDVAIDGAEVSELSALVTENVVSDTFVDQPIITQNHIILVDDLSSSSEIDTGSISQIHNLLADEIYSAVELNDTGALSQAHVLAVDGVYSDTELLDAGVLLQVHNINPNDILSDTSIDQSGVSQQHSISPDNSGSDSAVDEAQLSHQYILSANDVVSDASIDGASIFEAGSLGVNDAYSSSEIDSPQLTQVHFVAADDVNSPVFIDNANITQDHLLNPEDISSDSSLDSPDLEYLAQLGANDASSDTSLDNVFLQQDHVIAPDNVSSNTNADDGQVTQQHSIAPTDVISESGIEAAALTQNHIIVPDDIYSGGLVDSVSLVQQHYLVADDVVSAASIDESGLSSLGNIDVQNAASETNIDNAVLEQQHVIVPNDGISTTSIDEPAIVQDYYLLADDVYSSGDIQSSIIEQDHYIAPTDIHSDTSIDNADLISEGTIVPLDTYSYSNLDIPLVTQNHVVSPDDIYSEAYAQSANLTQDVFLGVDDVASTSGIDGAVISSAGEIVPDTVYSLSNIDSAQITQVHYLQVDDIYSGTDIDEAPTIQNHFVLTDSIYSSGELDQSSLLQDHNLSVDNLYSGIFIDVGSLQQAHYIYPSDLYAETLVDLASLIQNLYLSANDLYSAGVLSSPALTVYTYNYDIEARHIIFSGSVLEFQEFLARAIENESLQGIALEISQFYAKVYE